VEGRLQRHVLHSFALREPRERLLQDHPLEVRRLLVRLERGFVAEHLVEQELRRIGHTPRFTVTNSTPGSLRASGRKRAMMLAQASASALQIQR
jgi:hypothetical protein